MDAPNHRLRLFVRGAVQGVGFRPTVYRIATSLGLFGFVNNSSQGVTIEVEGTKGALEKFEARLRSEKPPRAVIQGLETTWLDPIGYAQFEVQESVDEGSKTTFILPDIATCNDCLGDIFDSTNRRHLYPFTNCTNCGPRFSIIEELPYDRKSTTMRGFPMCTDCRVEYSNPADRRFHAQPNACPACGPHIEVWNPSGKILSRQDAALLAAAEAIRKGSIVAIKGLGGFHLVVDARNENSVRRLRERKHREEKPFAVMFPDLQAARMICEISETEERLLLSPESPIVLLKRKSDLLPALLAPRNPYLGVMLPYMPLHHILMRELGLPIVATSGNLTDEPICTDEKEALDRLARIADLFLVHNRPIARYVDDSIVRIVGGREMMLRRARGYAPMPVARQQIAVPLLAVGAHLKNSIAFSTGGNIFVSHHIGDLKTPQARDAFKWVSSNLPKIYDIKPVAVACDLHPDYASTEFAHGLGWPVVPVQHHFAHALACMADNDLTGSALAVAWDGTGLGTDQTIWGGEFLRIDEEKFERIAHLKTFPLPGGDAAARDPSRAALGVLYETFGAELFDRPELFGKIVIPPLERGTLRSMFERSLNAPRTSSAGRLFDAVAAIAGIRSTRSFEGQAAMELEFVIGSTHTDESYPYIYERPEIDWRPMIRAILEDTARSIAPSMISAKFHNTLAKIIVAVAQSTEENRVLLTGGCFQNLYLTELSITLLNNSGFLPYWHQRLPPNDGGIALGQIIAASYALRSRR